MLKVSKKIVCSISGNDYIDYEDNLLENGLDSLLLSQISGRIVSDIQEAQGMRFDEILRASLTMPTIMGIAQYISDCKNPSKIKCIVMQEIKQEIHILLYIYLGITKMK